MKISINLFITPSQNPRYSQIAVKKAITIICMAIIVATAGIDVQAKTQAPVGWSTTFNLRYCQDFEEFIAGNTPNFEITTNDAIEGNVSMILRNKDESEGVWFGFAPTVTPF